MDTVGESLNVAASAAGAEMEKAPSDSRSSNAAVDAAAGPLPTVGGMVGGTGG